MIKRALLVGVPDAGDSGAPFLTSVERDIALLSAVLKAPDGPDFSTTEIAGPDVPSTAHDTLARRIESFFLTPAPSTLNLLYVAAHASVSTNGLLQILASDYSKSHPQATSISLSFIGACLPCGEQDCSVILLDCCFADRGAWELFSRQPSVLSFGSERNPSYCVISSTRASDPAVDGLFAPILAEALERLNPDPRLGGSVTLDRIYDYVESQLRPQYQAPRLWQSRSTPVPFGRTTIGLCVNRSEIPDLYSFSPSRFLTPAVGPQVLYSDYIDRETTDQGFGIRTGLRVLEGKPEVAEVEQAVRRLEEAVSNNALENGLVILTDDNDVRALRKERVIVRSYAEFRRVLLPTLRYLENWVADYEAWDPVHVDRCYVSLTAHFDEESEELRLDDTIINWSETEEAVPILTILGEFGTGKTTTLRRIFWGQARKHLTSPSRYRLPIFVTLREIDGALDMEALVERSVAKVVASRRLAYQELDELNKHGRILWLLDGFDEMAVRVTESVITRNLEQILRLAERRSRIVLTCRTSFFRNHDEVQRVMRYTELHNKLRSLAGGRYKILTVDQLATTAIEAFVRAKTNESSEILNLLGENPEFRNLAGRPILLQMIVETLPSLAKQSARLNAANLYHGYTQKLLLRDAWRNTLEEDDRRRFCQFLAWTFYSTGEYEISYSAFPELIRSLFPEDVRLAEDWKALEVAVRSTSFLSRDERGQFSFAHKSFMEFFAASYLLDRILSDGRGERELGSGVHSIEVSRFLAQLVEERVDACRTITKLAASSKFSLKYFFATYLRERLVPVSRRKGMTIVQRSMTSKLSIAIILGAIFLAVALGALIYQEPAPGQFRARQWVAVLVAVPSSVLGTTCVLFLGYCWGILLGTEGNPYRRLNATVIAIGARILPDATPLEPLLAPLPSGDKEKGRRLALAMSSHQGRAKEVPEPKDEKIQKAALGRRLGVWVIASVGWLAGVFCLLYLAGRHKLYWDSTIEERLVGAAEKFGELVLTVTVGGALLKFIAYMLGQPSRCPPNFIRKTLVSGSVLGALAFISLDNSSLELLSASIAVYVALVAASLSRSSLCYSSRLWLHVAVALGVWPLWGGVYLLLSLNGADGIHLSLNKIGGGILEEWSMVAAGVITGGISSWVIFRGWSAKETVNYQRSLAAMVFGCIAWTAIQLVITKSIFWGSFRISGVLCVGVIGVGQGLGLAIIRLAGRTRGIENGHRKC